MKVSVKGLLQQEVNEQSKIKTLDRFLSKFNFQKIDKTKFELMCISIYYHYVHTRSGVHQDKLSVALILQSAVIKPSLYPHF